MRARILTITMVAVAAAASTALEAYLLFVSHRNLVTTGDAQLQRSVSPGTARWLYLGGTAVIAVALIVTAVLSTRPTPSGPTELAGVVTYGSQPWWLGAAAGGALGLVIGLAALALGATARTVGPLTAPTVAAYLALLIGGIAIGAVAARSTGRTSSGALAGFWFAVMLALLTGLAPVARDALFAGRLSTGAWLLDHFGDPTCNHVTGGTLSACEIGDSLGAMASQWLLFPILGTLTATLGGAVGRATRSSPLPAAAADPPSTILAPAALCGILLLVFAAEIILHIW